MEEKQKKKRGKGVRQPRGDQAVLRAACPRRVRAVLAEAAGWKLSLGRQAGTEMQNEGKGDAVLGCEQLRATGVTHTARLQHRSSIAPASLHAVRSAGALVGWQPAGPSTIESVSFVPGDAPWDEWA